MQTRIFHLQALSALHVGTGQGIGIIDLPIARAKATHLPIVPGSALKGVMRDEASSQLGLEEHINTLFGPESSDENTHAGALAFGDAQLLLFPTRSFAGTLAYATCPFILRQYKRDVGGDLAIPNLGDIAGVTKESALLVADKNQIALEDLDINADSTENITAWAELLAQQLYPSETLNADDWQQAFKERFVVLPDNIFSFLADTATEVRTRIRINRATRTVEQGALWNEENLPAESVLWGVIGISASRNKNSSKQTAEELAALLPLNKELSLQIGGKHTVGRGLCRLLLNQKQ